MTAARSTVRHAAVAGSFYPADERALRQWLRRHLEMADAGASGGRPPKLLVVPHAGYVYSGDVAALAYAPLAAWRERITRVVLLGPAHRVPLRGLAAPTLDAFETPLGRVALDRAALDRLRGLRQVLWTDVPHADEHALEVQLPFLQTVLGDAFGLVPLVVGKASAEEVAEVVQRLWGGDETLILVSSDLSHYLPYAQAQARDRATVQRMLDLATDLEGQEACGAAALNGALLTARRHGLRSRLLGLRTSADAPGLSHADRERVVGYGAIAFDPPPRSTGGDGAQGEDDRDLGPALLATARAGVAQALGLGAASSLPGHPALQRPGASFVTLHGAGGRLRGCVGRLEATRALGADVHANAQAAALDDERFEPLRAEEWPQLRIEVSVLGAAQGIAAASEAEALIALRPGLDGVILDWRGSRATLLPQVWQDLPDRAGFIAALKRKAGLAPDFWAADLRLSRYAVRRFADAQTGGPAA